VTDAALLRPSRIQYSRARGWREPFHTVLVSRGTRWGNPFLVSADGSANRERAVQAFREALVDGHLDITVEEVRRQLKGWNLGCWCPLDRPCHADVLLEVANRPEGRGRATPVLPARQGRPRKNAPSPY
jgi:Domain of unknown function (DUF4326)